MGNTVAKSPKELTLSSQRSLEKQRQLILQSASAAPPPGYVRAYFYSHLYQIYDKSPPDLAADIPLCPSGGLDLGVVKQEWGLETCLPVDPLRWKPFQPGQPNYLSAVAVEVLSNGQGCIKFIEPTVSHQTLMQRQTRDVVLGVATLIQLSFLRALQAIYQCLEDDTPLPAMYRQMRRRAQSVTAIWSWDDLLNIFILCMWFGLAVATYGGYIQWAPMERGRKWVRTGSFSL
ncbi:hypothetical protein R3P38DRAFT_2869594 [Favolaschia claudopus]|uniref:Uncharacterized protein n=1 Tax=Favolaschia claudopus TaxID=2862362 RepID=A0AAW0DAG2_9AGAR